MDTDYNKFHQLKCYLQEPLKNDLYKIKGITYMEQLHPQVFWLRHFDLRGAVTLSCFIFSLCDSCVIKIILVVLLLNKSTNSTNSIAAKQHLTVDEAPGCCWCLPASRWSWGRGWRGSEGTSSPRSSPERTAWPCRGGCLPHASPPLETTVWKRDEKINDAKEHLVKSAFWLSVVLLRYEYYSLSYFIILSFEWNIK